MRRVGIQCYQAPVVSNIEVAVVIVIALLRFGRFSFGGAMSWLSAL